jgi:CheY-like chemotaxis protein
MCATAENGAEALRHIEENGPYDIYFIDWQMPEMDGIELARRIKLTCAEKSVIIMVSAMEWTLVQEEAECAGVEKFLSKPLFPSAIADCISECVGAASELPASLLQSEEADDFEGRCILLAEDVDINREIVLALLEPLRFSIDCAANGREAVELFEAAPEKYDLIFMDVQMPEMDGYETTRRIRALNAPRAKSVPIVAMTANAFREDIEKCLEAGMNSHVGKPIDFEAVLILLRKYLRGRSRSDAEAI